MRRLVFHSSCNRGSSLRVVSSLNEGSVQAHPARCVECAFVCSDVYRATTVATALRTCGT